MEEVNTQSIQWIGMTDQISYDGNKDRIEKNVSQLAPIIQS